MAYTLFVETIYNHVHLTVEVTVEPAEVGSTEPGTGLKMEPDYPEKITIDRVLHKGEDILQLLDSEVSQALHGVACNYTKKLKEEEYD